MVLLYIILGSICVWLIILSVLVAKWIRHYKKLTAASRADSLDKILDALMDQSSLHGKDIELIQKAVNQLDVDRHSYLQRFGYVKFNPFNDRVGGDQSFVIALLDNRGNGLVKTFMYTRDGVRVYVKPVKDGKSDEYELSDEEKEAIKNAS